MTLSVIGAGFGRTGTLAMKHALERLGWRKCYHMLEVRENPGHAEQWRRGADGETVDWDALFAEYAATVDWPACRFWRQLTAHYPEARVILTVRDPQAWYDSMARTVYRAMQTPTEDPARAMQRRMARQIVLEQTFAGRFEDREAAVAVFDAHNRAVRDAVAPERLLIYEAGEGWERLCRFLGCAVPEEPFPHVNTTAEFRVQQGIGGG